MNTRFWLWIVPIYALSKLGNGLLWGAAWMVVWNAVVPSLAGLAPLTFGTSVGIYFLVEVARMSFYGPTLQEGLKREIAIQQAQRLVTSMHDTLRSTAKREDRDS